MVFGSAHLRDVSHSCNHRHSADAVLPSLGPAGLRRHERPAVRGFVRRVSSQPASLVGPRHGFLVFAHMFKVFYRGAYRPPREFNWVIGVVLLLMTLLLSYTGYLL